MDVFIPPGHPAFAGHFPGQPLLPGVSLLSEVLEALLRDPLRAARVGPAPRLAAAKFLSPVRPGSTVSIRFTDTASAVRFEVAVGERVAASGHFECVS
ncbi:MAG TPA: 3-hydroxyacyl-ACP dehydratase [Rhizobacter sp.]